MANRANQATYSPYPSQDGTDPNPDKNGYSIVPGADPELGGVPGPVDGGGGGGGGYQDPKAIHADNQPLYLVLQRQETRPFGAGGGDDDPIAAALKPVDNEALTRTGRLFGLSLIHI